MTTIPTLANAALILIAIAAALLVLIAIALSRATARADRRVAQVWRLAPYDRRCRVCNRQTYFSDCGGPVCPECREMET